MSPVRELKELREASLGTRVVITNYSGSSPTPPTETYTKMVLGWRHDQVPSKDTYYEFEAFNWVIRHGRCFMLDPLEILAESLLEVSHEEAGTAVEGFEGSRTRSDS